MLSVENISFSVAGKQILKNVSFRMVPGEFLAIAGANGAGKSTLLNIINTNKKAQSGQIVLNGKNLEAYKDIELATSRAYLHQQTNLQLPFKARDIVMMGRYPHFKTREGKDDEAAVNDCISQTGIGHLQERNYLELSGGEQQRVQLARVLAQLWSSSDKTTRFLFLDEPVNNLDIEFQHKTLSLARALADKGHCVIAVLHDLNMAAMYADEILLMKHGRMVKKGPPAEVLTPDLIREVFNYDAIVEYHPALSGPYIIFGNQSVEKERINYQTNYLK